MWDQLAPGSKRFLAWLQIVCGSGSIVLAMMVAVSAQWSWAALFLFGGILCMADGIFRLKSIPAETPPEKRVRANPPPA